MVAHSKRNKSQVKKFDTVKTQSYALKLNKKPNITYHADTISWYKDDEDYCSYIIAGIEKNPISKIYQKILTINIADDAMLQLLNSSIDFIERFPDLKKDKVWDTINKKSENLEKQLSRLASGYFTHSSNAIRFAVSDTIGGELIFYHISPVDMVDFLRKDISKIEPEPTVRLTLNNADFFYFLNRIKESKNQIEQYVAPKLLPRDENVK